MRNSVNLLSQKDSKPRQWEVRELSQVADIRISNVDKKSSLGEFPVRLCNYMDVYSNEHIRRCIEFMEATASSAEIVRFRVEIGDVLATKDSETPDDIGVPAVVTENIPNLVCGYHLAQIKPNMNEVDPVFLSKQMSEGRVKSWFTRLANGSTRYGLPTSSFERLEVWLPPLPEQRKIARILTTVDELIEKTEAVIAKYEAIKQGMMQDLFTRGVDASGHLRPPQAEAPERYKQSELGWIPKEWEVKRLRTALQEAGGFLQTGPFGSQLHAHEYVDEGVPVIMPQDILEGEFSTSTIARITRKKAVMMARHRVQRNDIVFSRRGELSRAAAVSEAEEGWICGTGCFLLRSWGSRLSSQWLAYVYRHKFVQRQVAATAVGSTMPSLNNAVMEDLRIAFPSCVEQRAIVVTLNSHREIVRQLWRHLEKVRLVKSALMQDLLTDRIRVSIDDEITEDATDD